jgi:integrase/recombinase XerD
MRAFPVSLPSGQRYWTVLDEDLRLVWRLTSICGVFDWLKAKQGTTESYARSLALFFGWCRQLNLDWWSGGRRLTAFMFWLQYGGSRAPARVNAVVAA